MWPPHPIYVDRGKGSHVWDIDGNDYVDYHNGYGVMVMGHAHPKIVEAVQRRVELGTHFAQPTEDALIVAEQLLERTGLPYWRFGNSGTEATLDAVRIMRATTGRDLLVKIEGTYHGHHDALMVSVFPSREDAGPADHPNSVPQTAGMIRGAVETVINVPFNDADAAERVFAEHGSEIAGMIVEPVMTNCGVVLPDPGYLQRLKEICHQHGAMFAYDEVKTGFTVGWGGAVEVFGVQPDLVAYAKALGAGLPCGAIGGTEDAMRMVIAGELEQVGTFNGNPLTMAAAKVNLTEVLTKDAYTRLDEINTILHRCEDVIADRGLPASMKTLGAKGSIDWRADADPLLPRPVGHRRPRAAARVAVAAEPRRVQEPRFEVGELDDLDRDERRGRRALRRELRELRRRDHALAESTLEATISATVEFGSRASMA